MSCRNIFFQAHVERSNVFVDVRQKTLLLNILIAGQKREHADYFWSATREVFPKSVHFLTMPVFYQLIYMVSNCEGTGDDTRTKRTLSTYHVHKYDSPGAYEVPWAFREENKQLVVFRRPKRKRN